MSSTQETEDKTASTDETENKSNNKVFYKVSFTEPRFLSDAIYNTELEEEEKEEEEKYEFDDCGLPANEFEKIIREYCRNHPNPSYEDIQKELRKKAQSIQ